MLIVPPYQVPDESNHFYRAYQISTGQIIPLKSQNRVGGMVPMFIGDLEGSFSLVSSSPKYKTDMKTLAHSFSLPFKDQALVFKDFPHTAYYSPASYLPQSLSMFVCRKLNTSSGTLFYCARLSVFLVWLFAIYYSIKIIPFGKWLLFVLALLPMHLYVSISLSADTMTNALCFLLIAHVLKCAFSDNHINVKDIGVLFFIVFFLGLAKMIYLLMATSLFIIPTHAFGNVKRKFISLSIILIPSVITAALWSNALSKFYIPWSEYNPEVRMWVTLHQQANYHLQKAHLLSEPFAAFKAVFYTLVDNPSSYLTGLIGYFGTYMDTSLPAWICVMGWLLILYSILFDTVPLSHWRWPPFISSLVTLGALIIVQYLVWCEVKGRSLHSLQGRYLIPLAPYFFMVFSNNWNSKWKKIHPLLIIVAVIFLNVCSFAIIKERFFG